MSDHPLVALRSVLKSYRVGDIEQHVLRRISLTVNYGEFVAITGPSGAGKTTLLNIIGCLDTLDEGEYRFDGVIVDAASADDLSQLRRKHIGFVFQLFNLIPNVNAWRNVELPLVYEGVAAGERRRRAKQMLAEVELTQFADHLPTQLSGGQQQRVAIARALVNQPKLLVLDEPTGSLDSRTGTKLMRFFSQLHVAGTTIVMVTHDHQVADFAHRIIEVKDGHIVSDADNRKAAKS